MKGFLPITPKTEKRRDKITFRNKTDLEGT